MDNFAFIHDNFTDNRPIVQCLESDHLAERQAESLLLDADEYRSIKHKLDLGSLDIYRLHYSKIWRLIVVVSIVSLHCLAFIEYPSSLSMSSLVNRSGTPINRYQPSAAAIYSLEATFLITICIDVLLYMWLFGLRRSMKHPWMESFLIFMFLSWIDFFVTVKFGLSYFVRVRRFFRPVFAMQKSELMKKVLKSLTKTFVDLLSSCVLLLLWLTAFTLIAVSIFSGFEKSDEFDEQYSNIYDTFFTLLVMLTTANHPDAMLKEYNYNRFSFIFFFIFMAVGIFVFMNVLFAIVFHDFRGHVLDSMQKSFLHRRIASRAMFEVLNEGIKKSEYCSKDEIDADSFRRVIKNSMITEWRKNQMIQILDCLDKKYVNWNQVKTILSPMDELKETKQVYNIPIFDNAYLTVCQEFLVSRAFEIIGLSICLINVITIAIDISTKTKLPTTMSRNIDVVNWIFVCIYIVEQSAKLLVMGKQVYFNRRECIFDFVVTIIILVVKVTEVALIDMFISRHQYLFGVTSVWDLPRITNLLVMLRAVRVILLVPSVTPIINTLCDIPGRLRPIIGVLVLLFYIYALLGMIVFKDTISPHFMRLNVTDCGSFQQLNYGAFNFNDFFSSIVVLWCLLIVNNWQVFMTAFAQAVGSKVVHLYMISWWVLAVIVVLNCVTAFVIEGYLQRMLYFEEERVKKMPRKTLVDVIDNSLLYLRRSVVVDDSFTFQMLFKNDFIEPTEDELISHLRECHFLCEMYPNIALKQ